MKYEKEFLKEISFPLGGIGSGCIGLAGNGRLKDFEIFNRPNKNSTNGWTHFAVRCLDGEKPVDARVLVSDELDVFTEMGNGIGTDYYSMIGFPHFENSSFDGEYPIAKLDFLDSNFPAKVTLTAFNPIIPLDSKNSSIPAAFFEVEFENTAQKELDFEVGLSVTNPFETGINKAFQNGVVLFDGENSNNNLTIITNGDNTQINDYWYRGWWNNFYRDNICSFWNSWVGGEKLTLRNYTESGKKDVGTVAASLKIAPGEKKSVRFVLSWSIPDSYNYWKPLKDENGKDVTWKNYYATVFETSKQSAKYSLENWEYLFGKTNEFRNALYGSTIDESFKQAIGSALSVLKSPTVSRLEDGSLYGFEGSYDHDGSCEGLCQHVWNFAYICCYLFPDLERGIRDNEFKYGVLESGESVFRLPLPLDRKQFVNLFNDNTGKFRPALDGHMGGIIKAYREWKLSGNDEWLRKQWDTIKKMLDFAFSDENDQKWDLDRDGVLEGRQHHTLDIEIFGPCGWLEGFYLSALKCAAEMAEYLGDDLAFKRYEKLFQSGYDYTKRELFNGEYFIQKIDLKDKTPVDEYDCEDLFWNNEDGEIAHQIAEGCFIDQLCGQWHAILCGYKKPFDDEQAKKAILSIYKNNFKPTLRNFTNPWRVFAFNDDAGTVMCTYPKGAKKPSLPIAYCEEIMSGFEYEVAALLLYYGYYDEAVNVVKAVRQRYNGKNRNPWNDVECGHNYVRSMSAFSIIPVMSGFVADLPKFTLTFNPMIKPFNTIWSVTSGWGTVNIDENKITLQIKSGEIEVKKIILPFANEIFCVIVDGEKISDFSFENNALNIEKNKAIKEISISYE